MPGWTGVVLHKLFRLWEFGTIISRIVLWTFSIAKVILFSFAALSIVLIKGKSIPFSIIFARRPSDDLLLYAYIFSCRIPEKR